MKKILLTKKNLLAYFGIKNLNTLTAEMIALFVVKEVVLARRNKVFIIREIEFCYWEKNISGINFRGNPGTNEAYYFKNDSIKDKDNIEGKITLFIKED